MWKTLPGWAWNAWKRTWYLPSNNRNIGLIAELQGILTLTSSPSVCWQCSLSLGNTLSLRALRSNKLSLKKKKKTRHKHLRCHERSLKDIKQVESQHISYLPSGLEHKYNFTHEDLGTDFTPESMANEIQLCWRSPQEILLLFV